MERIWKKEIASREDLAWKTMQDLDLISDSIDRAGDRSQLPEEDLQALEDLQVEHATESSMGDEAHADVTREKALLEERHRSDDCARGWPDARVRAWSARIRQKRWPATAVP